MAIPEFFTKPNFIESSKIALTPLSDVNDNIIVLYDITRENSFGKLAIRSIKTNPIYFIILYENVNDKTLNGPCILIDTNIKDLNTINIGLEFSGILLARASVYKTKFKKIRHNDEITSETIEKILRSDSTQHSSWFSSWIQYLWGSSNTDCDTKPTDGEKYLCYYEKCQSQHHQCTNHAKQLQQMNDRQYNTIAKKDMKIRETQKNLRDSNIIICLFLICILFTFFLEETRMTYVKLYAYLIAFAFILLYLMYLVWFT